MNQIVVDDFICDENFHADLIGLTATPGRSYSQEGLSDEDKKLADFFNNNKVSMQISGYLSPIDYLVENGYLAKANFKSLNYDHSGIAAYELRDSGGNETMKTLANNVERNKKVIEVYGYRFVVNLRTYVTHRLQSLNQCHLSFRPSQNKIHIT